MMSLNGEFIFLLILIQILNLIFFRGLVKSIGVFVLGVRIAKEFVGTEIMPPLPA